VFKGTVSTVLNCLKMEALLGNVAPDIKKWIVNMILSFLLNLKKHTEISILFRVWRTCSAVTLLLSPSLSLCQTEFTSHDDWIQSGVVKLTQW
jgi:hypothetical protein